MTVSIVPRHRPMLDAAIHASRFVTAYPDTFKGGRLMYRDGKRRDLCTPTQAHGFDFEEARCEDDYYRCMMAQASDSRPAPRFDQEF